jgi:transposase-like protein
MMRVEVLPKDMDGYVTCMGFGTPVLSIDVDMQGVLKYMRKKHYGIKRTARKLGVPEEKLYRWLKNGGRRA